MRSTGTFWNLILCFDWFVTVDLHMREISVSGGWGGEWPLSVIKVKRISFFPQITSRSTRFQDRHATGHSTPKIDSQQDYVLIALQEESGKTVMKFKRKFETCDTDDNSIKVNF